MPDRSSGLTAMMAIWIRCSTALPISAPGLMTHIREWLNDAEHWQAVTRQIEDKLSDALHDRLTQRFVDKRTSTLLRGLASRDKLLGGVKSDGAVIVEGHRIGRLQGWHFMAEETLLNADQDAVMRAARTVLKAPLANAIGVFAQQVSAAFSMDNKGQILWRHGEDSFPIARFTKGAGFYQPNILLLHTDLLEDAQNKTILTRLEAWFDEYRTKHLGPLLALKDADDLKGAAKGIAYQLYEQAGLLFRSDLVELLKTLEKEERPALSKLGVKLGAYYVYQRDILKPAALALKAMLWRLANNDTTEAPLPQAGNVSMAFPEGGNREFYRQMGFPVFGGACVRVDMVERLNSAVFDAAVEGKYKFDPALASTIGVNVETVQAILVDLGFRFEETSETTGEGEEAVTTTTRHYFLRKRPVQLKETPRPKRDVSERPAGQRAERQPDKHKRNFKPKPTKPAQPHEPPKSKAVTGYNAFAELAALKKK